MDDSKKTPEEKQEEFDLNKSKTLPEKLNYSVTIGPVPLAPDGGPIPGYGFEPPVSLPDIEEFVCLQGPCRHYWQMEGRIDTMNAAGTWESLGVPEPRQIYRTCLVHTGVETTLSSDDMIVGCNRWDPMTSNEIEELADRRKLYKIRRNKDSDDSLINDLDTSLLQTKEPQS